MKLTFKVRNVKKWWGKAVNAYRKRRMEKKHRELEYELGVDPAAGRERDADPSPLDNEDVDGVK